MWLLFDRAGQFFLDFAGFHFVNDLLVMFVYRATASVLGSGVQASLFDMPLGNFQMLVNIHVNVSFQ
jgi:hypothetical protein